MKSFAVLIGALVALASVGEPLAQTDFPTKPVQMVVGFPPGGGNDVLARMIAEKLQASLGQPFVVMNRPGANGFIAIDAVKRAAPDGYTLLVGPSSGMTVNPAVYAKLPYDPVKDFAPVAMVGAFPLIVVVHSDSPIKSIADLIAEAKRKPAQLAYSSAATSFQLVTEMFAQRAGVSLYHVPYQGSSKAVQAVLANEVPMTFADASVAVPQIRAGRLRAIGTSSAKRVPTLPDVPTIAESGVPGFDVVLWSGIFAPAGTPPAVVAKLQQEVAKAVRLPELQERLQLLGVVPVGGTSEELAETMKTQIIEYTNVAKTANIKAEGN